MNYQHIYHAGNFADVIKHCVLLKLINSLKIKETGFCYIDSHAGAGIYDLRDESAQKTQEASEGIQKIFQQLSHPPLIEEYIQIIKSFNSGELQYYPGSPLIVQTLLRPQDRMILNELHPDAYLTLRNLFKGDPRVACHHRDAYEFLPAVLPPNPKRGLILIDPPYESKHEFHSILENLKKCHNRWPHGIYVIWYPIKTQTSQQQALLLKQSPFEKFCHLQFKLTALDTAHLGLIGCGMLIFNPPWQIESSLQPLLNYLKKVFQASQGLFTIR